MEISEGVIRLGDNTLLDLRNSSYFEYLTSFLLQRLGELGNGLL